MTLPTGQFWCWRDDTLVINVWSSSWPPAGRADVGVAHEPVWLFKRKYGVRPLPGEALLLDNEDGFVAHCPDCRVSLLARHNCPECKRTIPLKRVLFHARIVTRKPLEDKP